MAKGKQILIKSIVYLIAISGAVIILLPFYVTLITALKTPQELRRIFLLFPKVSIWKISRQCLRKQDTLSIL